MRSIGGFFLFLMCAGMPWANRDSSAGPLRKPEIKMMVTNDDGFWRYDDTARFSSLREDLPTVIIDRGQRYQSILGFGAALTDASCHVLLGLSQDALQRLLIQLFSPSQLSFNVCRVPVGASDYSREIYTYDDVPHDDRLAHFSIKHDKTCIIPVLRAARAINPGLFLFSSPWSPPGWMKTSGSIKGGAMQAKYLKTYARYYVRYLQEYANAGVHINALTPQNEPETDQDGKMPATYWPADFEASFVSNYLAPMLRRYQMDTKIWILDHNYDLWERAKRVLDAPNVGRSVDGVAFHFYGGQPEMMARLHQAHPEAHIYWTEGGPDLGPEYGKEWCRWSQTISEVMRNWARSFTAWNLALDEHGEPNTGPFHCAGMLTVHSGSHEISYSGLYRAIGHFSRFVRRGARRIGSTGVIENFNHIAFENPDGSIVTVLTNPGPPRKVQVQLEGGFIELSVSGNSISTLLWRL